MSSIGCEKPQITPGNFLLKLAVHGGDQVVLILMKHGAPLFFWLQPHEVFGIEEAGMVGAVIGTARLAGAVGRFRKGAKQDPCLIGDRDAFGGSGALIERAAHPQRALIQMGKKLGTDDSAEGEIDARHRPATPTPTVNQRWWIAQVTPLR